MSSFKGENMQTECFILSYRIDLYFHDYKLAIEIDENRHRDGNIDYEMKGQKVSEQELGFKLIRIDLDKEDFDIFRAIDEILKLIKQSTLINKISTRLKRLEFKSDKITKYKATKFLQKNIACVSCKKNNPNENSNCRKNKQNKILLLSNCAICGKKKLTITKDEELHNFND